MDWAVCFVGGLHHDADHGLGAGGAEQDAAGFAQLASAAVTACGEALVGLARGCGPRP